MVYVYRQTCKDEPYEPKNVATKYIERYGKSNVLDDKLAQNKGFEPPLFASQEAGQDLHQEDWDFDAYYVVFGKPIIVYEK